MREKKKKRQLHLTFGYSRSAAEIDELYERKIPAWRWSKTVTEAEQRMQTVVLVKGGVKENQNQSHIQ